MHTVDTARQDGAGGGAGVHLGVEKDALQGVGGGKETGYRGGGASGRVTGCWWVHGRASHARHGT
jgi:hypothetical protein